jgi:rhodanese-related sulfurtransferase
MKTLYTFIIALLTLNVVHAQLPLKDNWSRALLTSYFYANGLGTDTIQKTITDVQADSLIKTNASNNNFYILDVRTPDEYRLGHLKNSNNINSSDPLFNQKIDSLDRDNSYLVYCAAGGRSIKAFNKMVSLHFREVYNMAGGFSKWQADGYPYEVDTANNIINYQLLTKDIKIYPNPATEKVILEINQPLNSGTLSIFNSNGREQSTQQILDLKSEINISTLPAGIYKLRITADKTFGAGILIKQ